MRRDLEGALHAQESLAASDGAESGLAGRQHGQLDPGEIQLGDLQGREDAIVIYLPRSSDGWRRPRDPREQPRMVAGDPAVRQDVATGPRRPPIVRNQCGADRLGGEVAVGGQVQDADAQGIATEGRLGGLACAGRLTRLRGIALEWFADRQDLLAGRIMPKLCSRPLRLPAADRLVPRPSAVPGSPP